MKAPRAPQKRSVREEERDVLKRLGVEVTAEAVIAGGALILSLTTAGAQLYLAMRGPVIDTLPIDRVMLYQDANRYGAVLTLAARTTMINTAAPDYGDILEKAELTLKPVSGGAVSFPFDTTIKAHLVDDPAKAAEKCEVDSRCIALEGLVIDDRNERLVDLPGGKARMDFLAFSLKSHPCTGDAADCARFRDFDGAVNALAGQPLTLSLSLKFHNAKARTLQCKTRPVNAEALRSSHWLSFSCSS